MPRAVHGGQEKPDGPPKPISMGRARGQRVGAAVAALVVALLAVAAVPSSQAQVPPLLGETTTTTTEAPATTTTTAPSAPSQPSGGDLADGSAKAPEGAKDPGGDGAVPPAGGIAVPPEARRIIDSVARTGSNRSDALVEKVEALQAFGISLDEAYRIGMGRFPIAGRARYSHDWLFPRYGPGFRFHLGTDVFAAHGTPVRAPVDGIARTSNNALGGLSVKVIMPDGTYFYLAHLSGLVDGFTEGMPVATGDIVGYVGDSGNARGGSPHLHIGIYPYGGPPVDPKPILDGFITEAEGRLPDVIAALTAAQAQEATAEEPPVVDEPGSRRPAFDADAVHRLALGAAGWPAELLYALAANSVGGGRSLVQMTLDDMAAGIDWSSR